MGIDFCNETERLYYIHLFSTAKDMDIKPLYTYLCPVIIFVCFSSIIFNAILMSISRQSKVINKSPILLLSLNLAVTDLIASLLNGLGILFNSYLPEVHDIMMGQCSMLMFEVVRCAALVASALHLLALAFVHYRGIVNPLHYRSTIFFSQHLSRTINIISIACWIIPLTIMMGWFSSSPCQGFQSPECDYLFLLGFTYRYMVLTLFALPLMLMSAIYLRIFIIISRHQKGRRQNNERSTLSRGVLSATAHIGSAAAVNLPELIANSDMNRCPACVARAQHDEDEFMVSALGEETVEEAVDGDTVCRCTDEFDEDDYQGKLEDDGQLHIRDNPEKECSPTSISMATNLDATNLTNSLSGKQSIERQVRCDGRRQTGRPITTTYQNNGSSHSSSSSSTNSSVSATNAINNNSGNKTDADTFNLLSSAATRYKLVEEPARRHGVAREADRASGGSTCANQRTMALNSGTGTTTILYNDCDIADVKNVVHTTEKAPLIASTTVATVATTTTTTMARDVVVNGSPEQKGVEVILIKAERTKEAENLEDISGNNKNKSSSNYTAARAAGRTIAGKSVGYTSSTTNFDAITVEPPPPPPPPIAKLRKQLDKSSDPREAEQSTRVDSTKTVSLVDSEEAQRYEVALRRDRLLEPKRTASYKSDVSRPRVAVRAQVSLGSGSGGGCGGGGGGGGSQTTGSEVQLLTLPDAGSRCQFVGRQHHQRHKCNLHRGGQLSLDQQSSQPLVVVETRQRSNLISRDCTCDNKLDRSKLSRANTIASDSSRTNTLRGAATTTTDKTILATTAAATVSQRSSISSATANTSHPIRGALSCGDGHHPYRFGSSQRRKARSHASGSGGTGSQLVQSAVDNRSNAVSNSFAMTNSPTYEPQRRHMHASAVPQTNTKALVTTLLILGTYFISYVPAIIFQVLTCIDDCPYPLYTISFSRRLFFGSITTLLLIAKSIIDPFIYSYRMNEIQVAIGRYLSKRRSKTSLAPNSMHASQRHNVLNNVGHHQQHHSSYYQNRNQHHNNLNISTQGQHSFKILNSSNKSSLKSATHLSSSSRSSELHKQAQIQNRLKCTSEKATLIIDDNDIVKSQSNKYCAPEAHELLELIKNEENINKIQQQKQTSENCANSTRDLDNCSRIKFSLLKEPKSLAGCDDKDGENEAVENGPAKGVRCNGFRAFDVETPVVAKSFELIL